MSEDTQTAPPKGYTLRIALDESRHYDCNFCSASSPDLDGARAHHAVHVAGPDLLAAVKNIKGLATYERGIDRAALTDLQEDLEGILEAADSAIATAEPKG